jgi:signal peptidase I
VSSWSRLVHGGSWSAALIRAGVMATVLLAGSQYVLSPVRAYGISMQPTIDAGEWLWLWRPAAWRGLPRRGEVIGLTLAGGAALLVKRVIGLPGERIAIAGGVVFVNDVPLDEPYVTLRRPWEVHEVTLGADEIYVIGDNRGMPSTAHDFGRTSLARWAGRILGR